MRLLPVPRLVPLVLATAAMAVLCPAPTWGTGGQPQPLTPEQVRLLDRARDNMVADDETLDAYAYTLERRSYDVTLGKVGNGPVKRYEVGPSPFEPGRSWRRLVAENGRALTPEQLRRNEDRARRSAAERQRRLASETAPQRARRVAEQQKEDRERREQLGDVERVFRFEGLGREWRAGRPVLVVSITPRPEAPTVSKAGEVLKKMRGRAWVDELDAQVAELQMEAFADINFGWGVIGHVDRGATIAYRRQRLDDGTWLPVEARFRGAGRTLVLIPFQIETWAKYNDYRRVDGAVAIPAAGSRR